MKIARRAWLASLASLAIAGPTRAMGRIPTDGRLSFRLPWATDRLDPHDLFDPLAAIFARAIADPVYDRDRQGRIYPALAEGMPVVDGGRTVVRLRAGLHTAAGRALSGRDLVWSVRRARGMGAAGLLAGLTANVRTDPEDALAVDFGSIDPARLAELLASPLVALLPVGFSPERPDGTGPFRASCSRAGLLLARNARAARGPSFLESIDVAAASDMAESLRAFESARDDLGWLGLGLHGRRRGATRFDGGSIGWVVLLTGQAAGAFSAPGYAQQLANAVPGERLGLGLGARRDVRRGALWSGGPAELSYDGGSPQLDAIARAVAAKLSTSGNELTPAPLDRDAFRRRRAEGTFALALDLVRDPEAGPAAALIAMATADRPALGRDMGRKPPRLAHDALLHHLTTSLRVGVLGGLSIRGGAAPGVEIATAPTGVDWGSSYRS